MSINFPQPPTERLHTSTAAPEPLRHQNSQCQFDETNVISICKLKKRLGVFIFPKFWPWCWASYRRMRSAPPTTGNLAISTHQWFTHLSESFSLFGKQTSPHAKEKKSSIPTLATIFEVRAIVLTPHLLTKGGVQDSSLLRLTSGYVPFVQKKRKGGESPRWTGGTSESWMSVCSYCRVRVIRWYWRQYARVLYSIHRHHNEMVLLFRHSDYLVLLLMPWCLFLPRRFARYILSASSSYIPQLSINFASFEYLASAVIKWYSLFKSYRHLKEAFKQHILPKHHVWNDFFPSNKHQHAISRQLGYAALVLYAEDKPPFRWAGYAPWIPYSVCREQCTSVTNTLDFGDTSRLWLYKWCS